MATQWMHDAPIIYIAKTNNNNNKKNIFFLSNLLYLWKEKTHTHIDICICMFYEQLLTPPHTPLVNNINSTIYFNSENEYNGNDEW